MHAVRGHARAGPGSRRLTIAAGDTMLVFFTLLTVAGWAWTLVALGAFCVKLRKQEGRNA